MASSYSQFAPQRVRSYVFRIPLCTRCILFFIIVFYFATLLHSYLRQWGSLIPKEVGLTSMYRLSTYPLMHLSLLHLLANILALAPLLSAFESEQGTLTTLILFTGPFSTVPGALYTLLERYILHLNTPVAGASIWAFLLLTARSAKHSLVMPTTTLPLPDSIVPLRYRTLPTALLPTIPLVLTAILVPHTSLLGHVCGCLVGYAWGRGWLRVLVPPEKILRWVESKLDLLGRLPRYVSVDQKIYGRYGVLPTGGDGGVAGSSADVELGNINGAGRRLGP